MKHFCILCVTSRRYLTTTQDTDLIKLFWNRFARFKVIFNICPCKSRRSWYIEILIVACVCTQASIAECGTALVRTILQIMQNFVVDSGKHLAMIWNIIAVVCSSKKVEYQERRSVAQAISANFPRIFYGPYSKVAHFAISLNVFITISPENQSFHGTFCNTEKYSPPRTGCYRLCSYYSNWLFISQLSEFYNGACDKHS